MIYFLFISPNILTEREKHRFARILHILPSYTYKRIAPVFVLTFLLLFVSPSLSFFLLYMLDIAAATHWETELVRDGVSLRFQRQQLADGELLLALRLVGIMDEAVDHVALLTIFAAK